MSNRENCSARIDVLIVEDDVGTSSVIERLLGKAGYTTVSAHTLANALVMVEEHTPEIVLLDLSLPDGDGVALIRTLKDKGVGEVIIVSGTNDTEKTHACLQAGVFDFLLKPASAQEIVRSVRRADAQRRLRTVTPQSYPAPLRPGLGALEGGSKASQELLASIKLIAKTTPMHALIIGQPGVLKADNAALIHHYSERQGDAWLINCASENDETAIVRFFGKHEEDDQADSVEGYLAKVRYGTLVLDDVSALPDIIQRKLVQFIETGKALAENALAPTQYNCSIIGILREPADRSLREGRLNKHLYYALSTKLLKVPPLVERRDDIEHFARYAVDQLNHVFDMEKSVSTGLIERLKSHYWPGNLVELANVLLTGYRATEPGEEIVAEAVQISGGEVDVNNKIAPFIGQTFRQVEAQLIEATLKANNHNKSQSAKILGISLKTLYNRLNLGVGQ